MEMSMSRTMKGMTLRAMSEACGGVYRGDPSFLDESITSVTTDSRKVEPGCLFIAIKGARSDGHDYIGACFREGALCCISEKELPGEEYPYIQVDSSLKALKDLARLYRMQLNVKVVGITGSVGKTSTKETVAAILSQKYRVLKTEGNYNNEIGLPLTVFRLNEEDEVAVLEMGISDFGEMSRLTMIAQPDICIITNIGCCHLENLHSRDGILKAKTEIFESMNPEGTVILNGDDDKLRTVTEVYGKKPVFFGIETASGIFADNIRNLGLAGVDCSVHCGEGQNEQHFDVHIPVAGKHMVYNVLAGVAAGLALGLSQEQIKEGVSRLGTIAGRNNLIKTEHYLVLDDCYNANPVSMRAAVDILDTAEGRKVCILGDMFELGEDEEKLHYEVGEYLAGKSVNVLLTAGSLSRHIARGAKMYIQEHPDAVLHTICSYDTKEELMDNLPGILQEGDSILVKASHGMQFPVIIEKLKNL